MGEKELEVFSVFTGTNFVLLSLYKFIVVIYHFFSVPKTL